MTETTGRATWFAKKAMPWVLTGVMLTAAWLINAAALPDGAYTASFTTTASVGKEAHTRNLSLTVTDVRAARSVTDATGWSADGNWLVVDVEAAAIDSQQVSALRYARLVIGDREFSAAERAASFFQQGLVPGVPRSGSIAFELPDDALAGAATLRLGIPYEPSMDGVIEFALDLDQIAVQDQTALLKTGWAR